MAYNYSNLIGSANTVAASMKNSLAALSPINTRSSHGPDICKESLVTIIIDRSPWHRGIQKRYIIVYSHSTMSVISEKQSCVVYVVHLRLSIESILVLA